MFCRRCGSQIPEGLGMCSVCGLETNAPGPTTAAPPPPATPAPSASAQSSAQSTVSPAPPAAAATGPVGVGGWLLFFCICFTILWPLWTLSQYAMFDFRFRGLGWFAPMRLGLGFVAGLLLWIRSSSAMVLLRVYFGLGMLLSLWALANWMRSGLSFPHLFVAMPFIRGFVIPLVFLICGMLYFAQSKRVRATYGSNLL